MKVGEFLVGRYRQVYVVFSSGVLSSNLVVIYQYSWMKFKQKYKYDRYVFWDHFKNFNLSKEPIIRKMNSAINIE